MVTFLSRSVVTVWDVVSVLAGVHLTHWGVTGAAGGRVITVLDDCEAFVHVHTCNIDIGGVRVVLNNSIYK